MAIDIRATVTCSLGTLISGSISDDYIQGSGLVKTRGSVEISALITPAIGTAVTFSYTKGGVTRTIPRKLRVLSSFADPFRRTTTVELGCKLTYLSDLQEPVDWTAFDDPQNAAYNEDDARIVTLPIYASSVMDKCLTELGISASSNPLTNKFSIAAFDFGAGYVSVLNDLLISESYCGYLDTNEVLQIFALDQDAGTGPVFTASDIVDLGPIGVGKLPGEAVTVSYSTLKLKAPDNTGDSTSRILWEEEQEISGVSYYYIAYDGGTAVYTGRDVTTTFTTYDDVNASERISSIYYLDTGKTKNVVVKRVVEVVSPTIKGLGPLASAKLSNGISYSSTEILASKTITNYTYDLAGELVQTETLEYEDQAFAAYRLGIPLVIGTNYVEVSSGLSLISQTITTDEKYGEFTKRVTSVYRWWPLSQVGQQAIAEARDSFTTIAAVDSYLGDLLGAGLVHDGTQINTSRLGLADFEGRPSSTELTNGAYAKDGDPNNGWRTESVADLELALGSATAQRRIEFSMPYAPDDIFSGPTGGPFTAVASDAPAKANRYGRVQNRLLLGNRSGINLQLAPEKLPAEPYSPLYVQASGLTALYRANANQWAFDSNGIVCSTDALFWAAVGGTGTFWFPVAPGITTLPAEPPIVDGQMNANTVVLPYNETAVYETVVRTQLDVTKFDYALQLLTEIPALVLNIPTDVRRILKVEPPAADSTLAALVPAVSSGGSAKVPLISINVQPIIPQISSGASLAIPESTVSITAHSPLSVGIAETQIAVPAQDIAIAALAPAVAAGASVSILAVDTAIASFAPKAGYIDPDFSSVSLLLHMDGSNNSTTFTDSSSNALSVTANGNAKISTAQSKFGGSSGLFDGTGDYLTINNSAVALAAGDFTIEGWVSLIALPSTKWGFAYNGTLSSNNNRIQIELNPNGTVNTFLQAGTGTGSGITGTAVLSTGTWYHIAFTKAGNNIYQFVDGVLDASGTYSTAITAANTFYVGQTRSGGVNYSINAYIDDFRVTKGIARYTAAFTVPPQAFANQ